MRAGEVGGNKVGEEERFLGPVWTGGEPLPTGNAPERERAGF